MSPSTPASAQSKINKALHRGALAADSMAASERYLHSVSHPVMHVAVAMDQVAYVNHQLQAASRLISRRKENMDLAERVHGHRLKLELMLPTGGTLKWCHVVVTSSSVHCTDENPVTLSPGLLLAFWC